MNYFQNNSLISQGSMSKQNCQVAKITMYQTPCEHWPSLAFCMVWTATTAVCTHRPGVLYAHPPPHGVCRTTETGHSCWSPGTHAWNPSDMKNESIYLLRDNHMVLCLKKNKKKNPKNSSTSHQYEAWIHLNILQFVLHSHPCRQSSTWIPSASVVK